MTAAERQRRYRRRRAEGRIVVPIEADAVDLAEALIAAGLLDPVDYDDRDAIAAAMKQALVQILPARDP